MFSAPRMRSSAPVERVPNYTCEARPSTTLSGGEGFLAAVAPALADVVRAHFGGLPIETVFIEEGIGSLDAETLDLAIETLLRLQTTDRMVSNISHAPDLRQHVDVLLEVGTARRGTPRGSAFRGEADPAFEWTRR